MQSWVQRLSGGNSRISVPLCSCGTTIWIQSYNCYVSSPAPSVGHCHPIKGTEITAQDCVDAVLTQLICQKKKKKSVWQSYYSTGHWHPVLEWMAKGATTCFCVAVCPLAVGGFLCLLSLDWLHLHSQSPLLILLVAQFTIAHLGPVLGACPVMTTAVGPPLCLSSTQDNLLTHQPPICGKIFLESSIF